MRVLLIDKNLVDPINRAKWRLLAKRPGATLSAVAPSRWIENFRTLHCVPGDDDGFPLEALPVIWPGYENRAFFPGGLTSTVRKFRPEVVIAFEEPFSFFAWQARAALKGLKPRPALILYTWDNLSDGRRYGYRPAGLYRFIERRVMAEAQQVWCANSEAHARFARDYPGKAHLLPFGLDLSRFQPSPTPGPRSASLEFRMGYVGRLLPMKGLETLLETLARLPPACTLTLVGNGPDRSRLEMRAQQLGVLDRVSIRPAVASESVAAEMRGFHLLVLPSRTTPKWKEQFGKVLVEAMACGVPVAGSSSGAIPDVVGSAGFVFPEGDDAALAEIVERLRADPELSARSAAAGLVRAREYSAERFAHHVEALMAELRLA